MHLARKGFYSTTYGFVVAHGSPLKQPFDLFTDRCHLSGLLNHWKAKYWPNKRKCDDLISDDHHVHSLISHDLVRILRFYFWACMICIISYIAEAIYLVSKRSMLKASPVNHLLKRTIRYDLYRSVIH